MTRVLSHVRANLVAYLALFVALGGTSYAASKLPAGSVGATQIKNHSIQPVKLDPSYIDGSVRVWASVNAAGKVVAGGAGVKVIPQGAVPGDYIVSPSKGSRIATPRGCAAIASVDDAASVPGYANAEVGVFPHNKETPWQVVVEAYDSQGQPSSLSFDFAIVC